MVQKSPNAFRTISEVADVLEVPAHVLRFWESKFSQIKPVKRSGGRRYYRPTDVFLIRGIRDLLYSEGLTIKGVQKVLREKGIKHVMEIGKGQESLWDEPQGEELEQKAPIAEAKKPVEESDVLFEMAEATAPAKFKPKASNVPAAQNTKPEPEIRSLFDEPESVSTAHEAVSDDTVIAKVARIAAKERGDARSSKQVQIKGILNKLENLRDRMKSG